MASKRRSPAKPRPPKDSPESSDVQPENRPDDQAAAADPQPQRDPFEPGMLSASIPDAPADIPNPDELAEGLELDTSEPDQGAGDAQRATEQRMMANLIRTAGNMVTVRLEVSAITETEAGDLARALDELFAYYGWTFFRPPLSLWLNVAVASGAIVLPRIAEAQQRAVDSQPQTLEQAAAQAEQQAPAPAPMPTSTEVSEPEAFV